MAKKAKKRKSSGDPLRVQVVLSVRAKSLPPAHVLQEAVQRYMDTGEQHDLIRVSAIHWQNPGRKNAAKRDWRTADDEDSLEDARNTLHALRSGRMRLTFSAVRSGETAGESDDYDE